MKNNRNIGILYALSLFQGMVFYGPIATLYRQAAGISILQITIIESISLALCVGLELPMGILADKIGYRKTMIGCCFLYFISKIIFWKAVGFSGFLAERVLLAIVCAGLSGCDVSLLYLSCSEGKSQRVFGIYTNFGTLGLMFASIVYSTAVKDSFRLAGFLTVVSYGISAFLALGLRDVPRRGEVRAASTAEFRDLLLKLLMDRRFFAALIGIAFFSETHQMITVFLNQLQYVKSGISPSAMGYIYFLITLTGLVGVFSAGITDKAGVRRIAALLYAGAVGSCILLAFTDNAVLSILGILILRVSFSLFVPLQTELQNREVTTANRATALSINALLMESVSVFTSLVFGAVSDVSLSGAMLFGAGLCASGYLMFGGWLKKRNEQGIPGRSRAGGRNES